MGSSNTRLSFQARKATPYISTTGKCLELFYWTFAEKAEQLLARAETRISVLAIDEDMHETVLNSSDRTNFIDFQRMFVKLPDGVHRIAIDGIRDSNVRCLLSVDDITIMDCKQFG